MLPTLGRVIVAKVTEIEQLIEERKEVGMSRDEPPVPEEADAGLGVGGPMDQPDRQGPEDLQAVLAAIRRISVARPGHDAWNTMPAPSPHSTGRNGLRA